MEHIAKILAEKTIVIKDKQLRGGYAIVPTPVLRCTYLSRGAKTAYGLLLSYAWQDDFCFPGQERMAEDCGVSADTLQRDLNELKDIKLIDWTQRGLNKTNIYFILPLPEKMVDDYEKRRKEWRKKLNEKALAGMRQEMLEYTHS